MRSATTPPDSPQKPAGAPLESKETAFQTRPAPETVVHDLNGSTTGEVEHHILGWLRGRNAAAYAVRQMADAEPTADTRAALLHAVAIICDLAAPAPPPRTRFGILGEE